MVEDEPPDVAAADATAAAAAAAAVAAIGAVAVVATDRSAKLAPTPAKRDFGRGLMGVLAPSSCAAAAFHVAEDSGSMRMVGREKKTKLLRLLEPEPALELANGGGILARRGEGAVVKIRSRSCGATSKTNRPKRQKQKSKKNQVTISS